MKRLFLAILAVLSASNITAAEPDNFSAQLHYEKVFSSEMLESINKIDAVKFKAALKNVGPLCKYGMSILTSKLASKKQHIVQKATNFEISEMKDWPYFNGIKENSNRLFYSTASTAFSLALLTFVLLEPYSTTIQDLLIYIIQIKKSYLFLAGIATGSYGIFGFNHVYKLIQEKKLEKESRIRIFKEKHEKKCKNLTLINNAFNNHPTKDCC